MSTNPPSFKSCWQRAIGESDLPPTTRLVLLTLSIHFMNEEGGHCFPSIEDIMRVTGLTKKYVVRHLSLAAEKGWLERWHFGKGRANRRRNYQATIPPSGIVENRPDDVSEILREPTPEIVSLGNHQPSEIVSLGNHQPSEIVSLGNHQPSEIVSLGNHQPSEIVSLGNHKPCRENINMEREATMRAGAESAAATIELASTLSEQEKNHRMTKLTDAVIEAAQKTVRQRNVREDLSDAALSHSIEKCRALKGYCEMTEAAWIETVVQWVGKERCENSPKTRLETCSPSTPIIPSPEEKKRQNAEFEARMAAAEAQHRQRLEGYRVATQHDATSHAVDEPVKPVDPVHALQALAAKVRMGATTAPAVPAQRTFGPMGALPARRPPLTAERRDALNQVLREMQKAGCSAADLTQIYQGVHDASEDAWPTVIAQARQRLTPPAQAMA
ncbi:MAG: helix-turn-helix domain-containing protein [Candidatus Competibacteraceae bacterium]|nr:helix-turn-helix domain-containing protein [Candidatus Competibacteraceae bacterium]